MSVAAILSADIRARAAYLPPCPLCSHVGIPEISDIILGPAHRQMTRYKDSQTPRHTLTACCALSAGCLWLDSDAECAAWWREERQKPLACIATDNRRKSQLSKLAALNLEPIEL